MVKPAATLDWREGRRRSAREAILDAAWALVGEEGLAGLSLRDLARRAGISTPTVYAYFDSKGAIYDAMFGQAAARFAEEMAAATRAVRRCTLPLRVLPPRFLPALSWFPGHTPAHDAR